MTTAHLLSPHSSFMTQPRFYPPMSHSTAAHLVSQSPPRTSPSSERKRPKYTRSKTGCLTCRGKKIKCDEAKPVCSRCAHGQRDCTWPEGVAIRKKVTPKYSRDGRPITGSGSDHISASSSPPDTREHSPKNAHAPMGVPLPDVVDARYNHGVNPQSRRVAMPVNPLSRPMHPDMIPHVLSVYANQNSGAAHHMSYSSPVEAPFSSGNGLSSMESNYMPSVNMRNSLPMINTAQMDSSASVRSYAAMSTHSPDGSPWTSAPPMLDNHVDSMAAYFRTPKERSLVRSASNTM